MRSPQTHADSAGPFPTVTGRNSVTSQWSASHRPGANSCRLPAHRVRRLAVSSARAQVPCVPCALGRAPGLSCVSAGRLSPFLTFWTRAQDPPHPAAEHRVTREHACNVCIGPVSLRKASPDAFSNTFPMCFQQVFGGGTGLHTIRKFELWVRGEACL